MKRLLRYTALLALLIVPLALVACGDDDGDGGGQTSDVGSNDDDDAAFVSSGEIRTSKGLTAAAQNAGFGSNNVASDGDDASESVGLSNTGSRSSAGSAGAGAGGPAAAPAAADSYAPLGADSAKSSDSSALAQAAAGGGLTVTGYGTAEAEADGGVIEFYFGSNGGQVEPVPFPEGDIRAPDSTTGAGAITEEDLQPVIDALVGAGVAADDIEVVGQGYYDPYYSSSTLRATVRDVNILESAANAGAEAAAGLSGFTLQNTNITYTLSNCDAMERAALETAAEDAADHAVVLAEVLNVGLGGISAASDYSYPYYYPYYGGGAEEVCASSYYGAIPFFSGVPLQGDRTVEVFGTISVTYAIG